MHIRLLFASPDSTSLALLESIYTAATHLLCFTTSTSTTRSISEMMTRVVDYSDDVILLDWPMAESETPELVTEILTRNPKLRVVVLLPENYRQYRMEVWNAGACNSIPKELMEQEWLSSILCVMYRAMQREARLIDQYEANSCRVA